MMQRSGETHLFHHGDRELGAAPFVAVRRVDHHGELVGFRELDLRAHRALLGGCDRIESHFSDGDAARMLQILGKRLDHAVGHARIVGFLGIEGERHVVVDAVVGRARGLRI